MLALRIHSMAAAGLGLGVLIAAGSPARAQGPLTNAFTYQGVLNQGGSPASGVYDLRFRLYDALTLGAPQGSAVCLDNVSVVDGLFTVSLDFGAQYTGQRRFLELEVRQDTGVDCSSPSGFTLLSPRQELTAVPHAMYALSANGSGMTNLNAANITSGTLAATHMPTGGNWLLSSPLDVDSNTLIVDAANNRVGMGTAAPATPLHVVGNWNNEDGAMRIEGDKATLRFTSGPAGGNQSWMLHVGGNGPGNLGIYNRIAPTAWLDILTITPPPGGNLGIGTSTPLRHLHVRDANLFTARFENSHTTAAVVEFQNTTSAATWEYGVAGSSPPFPGQLVPFAVLPGSMYIYKQGQARPGLSIDPGGTVRAHSVNAVSLHAGTLNWTDAVGTSGRGNSHGIFGATPSTGDIFYGVYGVASGAAHAVFADGKFTGNGTKSFRIDHPADPQNKYLTHYCAESPDVINFYSGTVVLDSQGEAEVSLPSYFASINRDPRYGLTAIGAPMPMLHVAREIDSAALKVGADVQAGEAIPACSFRIAGGVAGAKVSWEVKAVRNDRWMQQHGAPVEQDKGEDRGSYQRPELYGASADMLPESHPNHPNHPLAQTTPANQQ